MDDKSEFVSRVCKHCQKAFYTVNINSWAYKIRHKTSNVDYFCSWSCLRKYERTHKPLYRKIDEYVY